MDTIGLEGMHFHAYHGYYKAEQKMGNPYILDVKVRLNQSVQASEDIHDTVNYEHIYKICKEEMETPRKLLETVNYHIGDRLKSQYPIIDSVYIKLRKVGVQLGGKIDASVIETEH